MYYYGFDMYYVILVLPAILFAAYAQYLVKSTFTKYSKVSNKRGITGKDAARMVMEKNGVYGVNIESIQGNLTDHYDSNANVIRLSQSVYNSTSVAALGVAAHEAGHAVQYAKGYGPIKLRASVIPVSQLGSKLAFPLILIGLILNSEMFFLLGILFFAAATVFQLVTLPVEFNASKRAMVALESGYILEDKELSMARKTLTAAALTYVAALIVSLAQLLRLMLLFGRGRRD